MTHPNPTHPDSTRHGRLAHARISVADAATFLRRHNPAIAVPTTARTAVALTGNAHGRVVAAALISPGRAGAGGVADAAVAWVRPTARMRTMLLAATRQRAAAMGWHVVLVHGDDRPEPHRVDILYPLAAPRRTRPATGIQITRHLWGRSDNHEARR